MAGGGSANPPEIKLAAPGDVEAASEQLVMLKVLYAECDESLKKMFPSILMADLSERTAPVVVNAFIDLGQLRELARLVGLLPASAPEVRLAVWAVLCARLAMESHLFTEDDLRVIESMAAQERTKLPTPPAWRGGSGSRG
jgi:hypothetical protein